MDSFEMVEGNRDVCFGGGEAEQGWEKNVIKDGGKQECLNIRKSRVHIPG